MKRVVSFYEKLPRGPAPEVKPTGLFGRYQAKHFGKNPTAKRMSQHVLLSLSARGNGRDGIWNTNFTCL
jgi:F-type H+-transporting ATPase subunit f